MKINSNDAPMLMYPKFLQAKERVFSNERMNAIASTIGAYSGGGMQNRGGYFTINNIAVVPVMGPLMKGWGYPDQSELRSLMRALKDDSSIHGVMKVFDSPGGSVAGTSDYADDLGALSASKPCVAYCEDMCASAAYWAASQCSKVYANSTALVGSIGVISFLTDASEYYKSIGVKEIPLVTGKFKAAGDPSQPATPEIVEYMQDKIDSIYDCFVSAVNKGRGISGAKIRAMEAAVFVGQAAVEQGLVDEICTMDKAFAALTRMVNKQSKGSNAKATLSLLELDEIDG